MHTNDSSLHPNKIGKIKEELANSEENSGGKHETIFGDCEFSLTLIKFGDTKLMMNTVRNSIYYLLYINPNMYK